jgi:hypothetical protein
LLAKRHKRWRTTEQRANGLRGRRGTAVKHGTPSCCFGGLEPPTMNNDKLVLFYLAYPQPEGYAMGLRFEVGQCSGTL